MEYVNHNHFSSTYVFFALMCMRRRTNLKPIEGLMQKLRVLVFNLKVIYNKGLVLTAISLNAMQLLFINVCQLPVKDLRDA